MTNLSSKVEKEHTAYLEQLASGKCFNERDGQTGHEPAIFEFDAQYPINICRRCYETNYRKSSEKPHNNGWFTLRVLKTGENIEPCGNPVGYRKLFPDFKPAE